MQEPVFESQTKNKLGKRLIIKPKIIPREAAIKIDLFIFIIYLNLSKITEKKPSVLCSSGVNLIYLSEFNGTLISSFYIYASIFIWDRVFFINGILRQFFYPLKI